MALEGEIAKAIPLIEELFQSEPESLLVLEETGFYVNALPEKGLQRYLVAVYDEKGSWVASVMLDEYPCMSVKEAKDFLRQLELSDTNPEGLTLADLTVGEALEDLEARLSMDAPKDAQALRRSLKAFWEAGLKAGKIKMSDKIPEAIKKIEGYKR